MFFGFDVEVAQKVDVEEAIMLRHIEYWVRKNAANKKNFYDGYYWTYNTQEAFVTLFPFWNRNEIRRIITNLIKSDYLKAGNYNQKAYDKTT